MADTDNTTPDKANSDPTSLDGSDQASGNSVDSVDATTPGSAPTATSSTDSQTGGANTAGTTEEDNSLDAKPEDQEPAADASKPEKKKRFSKFRQRFNIYFILLIILVLMAALIIIIAYIQGRSSSTNLNLKSQKLNQSTLQQLSESDTNVGSSQYILNVESNAVFAGQVITRQNLEVAGNLQVGGTTALNNISITGTGQFGQAIVNNNLTVGGNSSVQGSATIAKSLQVSNGGSFGGALSAPQITTSNLQLNGNLVLLHHVSVSGPIPSRTIGTAAGNGGSASVNGTDTAGAITINTGSSPAAGCFVTINFSTAYDSVPYVLVTPIGSAAGGLSYYVNRSTTSFSVCDASTPPAGSSFGFDYFITN